jgi:hypothetical protein
MTTQQMEAELMFGDPDSRDRAVVELTKQGFNIEFLDWTDECGTPTVWIKARGASELNDSAFFDEMMQFALPFNGEVLEAGYENPPTSA